MISSFILAVLLIGQRPAQAPLPLQAPTPPPGFVDPDTKPEPAPAIVPSVEPSSPPTITPNATAAQDAHGFTFYSLIDARGMTHWSYDWPRLWNEVQAVNAGANVDRAAQPPNARPVYGQSTYGQPATYGYGYGYGTGGSGGRPQPWVVRTGVYGRPVAVVPLPALGGAGAVCST